MHSTRDAQVRYQLTDVNISSSVIPCRPSLYCYSVRGERLAYHMFAGWWMMENEMVRVLKASESRDKVFTSLCF